MRSAIVAFGAAVVVLLSGGGSSSAANCITPSRLSHARHLEDGVTTSVRVGSLTEVELVEPALPSGYPTSFPWVTPRSTNANVLVAVALCPHHSAPSSLDVSITLFRAVRAGRATVSAEVAPAWQSFKSRPRRFSARVTVSG
jgi:hypothetical protein